MTTFLRETLPPNQQVIPFSARVDVVTDITFDPSFRKLRAIVHNAARDLVAGESSKKDTTNAQNKIRAVQATEPTLRVVKKTNATGEEIFAAELIVHTQLLKQESAAKNNV